jgi:hypothetical protein
MLTRKGIIPLIIIAFFALSSFAPQEEQWTDYLGRPFDSVVTALRAQYPYCDTHHVSSSMVIASCIPYEFIGEKGLLVLRRANNGVVKSCSWIRGEHPMFKGVLENIDSTSRDQLALKFGDLDRIFNAVWNYYDKKVGTTYSALDDGSYLWKPEQLKKKHIEYTMSRSLGYIEFSVTLNEGQNKKGAKSPKNPVITGK